MVQKSYATKDITMLEAGGEFDSGLHHLPLVKTTVMGMWVLSLTVHHLPLVKTTVRVMKTWPPSSVMASSSWMHQI